MASFANSNAASGSSAGGGAPVPGAQRESRSDADTLRRVPPHSVEAEQAVLGGILQRPNMMHNLVDVLNDTDFYIPANAAIFRAFLDLYGKSAPIDLVSVHENLKSRNQLEEAGGAVYLGDLAQAVVSGANADYYATIVRDKALQRNLIDACARIIGNCYDASRDVAGLLDES